MGSSDGMLFDIQHYAVHDGPGIRTAVFFKGCPLRCVWCCNPESQALHPELRYYSCRCQACFACAGACPSRAVKRGEKGPVLDRKPCEACRDWRCVEACPNGALARVGHRAHLEETMARIAADLPFYRNSGGGATFSGGEPFMQPRLLEDLLLRCKDLGIHTAAETCGYAPTETFLKLEPLVDLFLYDVKVMDPERHLRCTGASNELILANLRCLAERDPTKIKMRVPVVPGSTDSRENLSAAASLAAELGIVAVELMPYHELGRDKYEGFGRTYPVSIEGPHPSPASLEAARRVFLDRGVACEIGGE